MKTTALLSLAFASAALAQPHGKHLVHRFAHKKRDVVTSWTTSWVTETVIEYIDDTTTYFATPSASSSPPPATTTTRDVPGQFFPLSSSRVTTSSTSTTTLTMQGPEAAPAPVPTTTPTKAHPIPAVTTTPEETPTTPTTTTAAPPATTSGSGGGSGEPCPAGSPCTGDMTYYTLGMGACGTDNTGDDLTLNIVALSHDLMGSLSNDNPYCGKNISITYNDKSTTATVRDKCMGCSYDAIDVSEKVFEYLVGGTTAGRVSVQWFFID